MCELVNKLLELMKPFVENIESDFNHLNEKEQDLKNIDEILLQIDNNSFNILNVEDNLIDLYIDDFKSNKNEYQANKYILTANVDEVKNLPQYEVAKKYIDDFYEFFKSHREIINADYSELRKIYKDKELINKYYEMISTNDVFVDNIDELKNVFDVLDLSLDDKNNVLVYVLKENNKSYNLDSYNNSFTENENEKILKFLSENSELDSNEYDELLDAVSECVDITKDINDIIDYDLVDKINISNILLAKKIWLYRKINFAYYNMNCNKCSKVLNEFITVDLLYEKIKNIKNQNEVVRIIKGEN